MTRPAAVVLAHQEPHFGGVFVDEGSERVVDRVVFGGVVDEEEHFHPLVAVCY